MTKKVFNRVEKKYLISTEQRSAIIGELLRHMAPDVNGNERIFSLYFDTPSNLLIRRSIDKPTYKEKLRLRAYGVPKDTSQVFVEVKKKYKKTVYKRRAIMKYADAKIFLTTGLTPDGYEDQHQILDEIQWFIKAYDHPAPSILISYDRDAYYSADDNDLRITFDSNILWHDCPDFPSELPSSSPVIDGDLMIMEIKIHGAMPLWLVKLLSGHKIYPTSFSKVGTAYKQKLLKGAINYG